VSVTIQQIAEQAGISKATVSRVLNGLPVKMETEHKIRQVMERMNYRPNRFARSLTSRKTGLIGLLTPDYQQPYTSFLVGGIEEEAKRLGRIPTLSLSDQADGKDLVHSIIHPRLVDGLILIVPPPEMDPAIKLLLKEEIPFVVVSERRYEDQATCLVIDNLGGARAATRYLLGKGHKRVGVITGRMDLTDAVDRLEGYRQALSEASIPFREELVQKGDFLFESGRQAVERFLALPEPPTALFASNDMMAMGALRALWDRKRTDEIKVMGFDDLPLASYIYPSLTTVSYDLRELGKLAVSKLVGLIDGRETQRSLVQLKTRIVIRESA
jgi:DNA-binding LacI/PurR family transcriptional regulator